MTDLTEQWKNGKIEALEELINQIATVDDSRSLSDEYLKEKGLMTRDECGVAGEYPYGIVMVVSDYVLPYLKKLQELKQENQQLKDIISKMCMELVAPDDDMSNGLAEYFNQDLLLEINEALK